MTTENTPTLLASLGATELARTQRGIDYEISDFAGFARFLRGLAAKKKITTWEPIGDPKTDLLLSLCEKMWPLLFYREMVSGLLKDAGKLDKRRIPAGMMSLLGAVQCDLAYIDDSDERVRSLFSQFSDEVIEPALGISVETILTGFSEIRRLIPARIGESIEKQQGARELHENFKMVSHTIESEEQMRAFLESQPGFEKAIRDAHDGYMIQGRLFVFEPKDFEQSIGDQARPFLNAFSFTPGESNYEYDSPYDTSVHRSRPFAVVGDVYLLFDPCYCYFAPLHRLRECFTTDRLRQRLTKRRDKELEEVADRLFGQIINADVKYRSYYIQIDEHGRLAERDMLLIHKGVGYVVESKARPLRSVSDHKGNIEKIEGDFKKTIQEGYEQCVSVIKYIRSNSAGAVLYDSDKPNRQVVDVIKPGDITQFVPIVLLDSYYGFFATDLEPWLKVCEEVGFPWVVDRDSLAAFALKFKSADHFLKFVTWRRSVQGVAQNEDELCFAGYFLRHGAHEFPQRADVVQLDQNYSDVFEEEYFRQNGWDIPERSDFVGQPHWAGMRREGDAMVFSLDDQETESINIRTGTFTNLRRTPNWRSKRVGRNAPCPCGSGLKYKKCCLRK
ncbi:MAG: SEC-C domain-containing protein [Pirellulales bacterium]